MFCQITGWGATREPAHCRGATSKSGFPTIQASSCTQHPSNVLKFPGTTGVCHLTTWHKFTMDYVFPIIKHNQQHFNLWPIHPCFFWSRRPFPHPLRRLHLHFNIISINTLLIACYNVLKKVFITTCIGKHFLTDFNTFLFLIISQQTRHEFCTDATHLNFFSKNFMTRSYADAHFVINFSDS